MRTSHLLILEYKRILVEKVKVSFNLYYNLKLVYKKYSASTFWLGY
jgi:hypothetical protein